MHDRTLATRGFVAFLALLLTTCGGNVPTGPTGETRGREDAPVAAGPRVSSLSAHTDGTVEVLRAPASGQTMKVNSHGKLPQPAPKFRFKATASVDIPEGQFTVLFLTAAGKECGIAGAHAPVHFTANVAKTVDISNDAIVVGPEACAVDGMDCKTSQCHFPLTTTKMRMVFGSEAQGTSQTTESRQYKWTNGTPSGGGGGGGGGETTLDCGGHPVPDTVACGIPVAQCNGGSYSCTDITPCWNHFPVVCYVCPGPLCCHGGPPVCSP